jgi:hypothetical protein
MYPQEIDYDGGRRVTVYIPPVAPEAVVFAGDGQLISQWDGVLEAAGAPPTMIVGTHRLEEEMLRLHEYSPAFDREVPIGVVRLGLSELGRNDDGAAVSAAEVAEHHRRDEDP